MCGIAGFWELSGRSETKFNQIVREMADTLTHRGPDDSNVWLDSKAGFALGHRRLSIMDLSPAGRQPMISRNGRFVIAFNGEIYNHLELRSELNNNSDSSSSTSPGRI